MQTDPFEARRTGAHRLHVVTASIGAAAVVGTGALTWSLVTGTPSASAGQTSTSDDGSTVTSNSDDGSTGTSNGDDSFVPAPTVPQPSFGGSTHASSGGS